MPKVLPHYLQMTTTADHRKGTNKGSPEDARHVQRHD